MGRDLFYSTLFVTAGSPEGFAALVATIEGAVAKQEIRENQPPAVGPPVDSWSASRVAQNSLHATFETLDMDSTGWIAELASRHVDARFDLIQEEGNDIPFPEGVRFTGTAQLTGVPLFLPTGSSTNWTGAEEEIRSFDPSAPELVEGAWELLQAPPQGTLPGDRVLDGSPEDHETLQALAEALPQDLELIKQAVASADVAPVVRPDGTYDLALLAPIPTGSRPEIYILPGGSIAEGWQPRTDDDIAVAVTRLLVVGALKGAGADAPLPL